MRFNSLPTLALLFLVLVLSVSATELTICSEKYSLDTVVEDCVPSIDLGPGIVVMYSADEYMLVLITEQPPRYFSEPLLYVLMYLVNAHTGRVIESYSGILNLRSRTFSSFSGKLLWYFYPLAIPKGLGIGDSIALYNGTKFRVYGVVTKVLWIGEVSYPVKGIPRINGKRMVLLRCLMLSNGSDVMYFDEFSGIFVEGVLRLHGKILRLKLVATNVKWRVSEYSVLIDWYRLRNFVLELKHRYRDLVHVDVIGHSVLGREIYVVELNPGARYTILITACIHGDEVITAVTCLYTLKKLCSLVLNNTSFREELIRCNVAIAFIPMLNPDGVERAKIQPPNFLFLYSRCNARYVDLNRNFPQYWLTEYTERCVYGTVTYRGPKPASEPETRALMRYVESRDVVLHIDLHSGIKLILVPYENSVRDKVLRELIHEVASSLGIRVVLTAPSGEAIWWTYLGIEPTKRALSLIYEIYRGEGKEDYFQVYNPVSKEEVEKVCKEASQVLITIIRKTLRNLDEIIEIREEISTKTKYRGTALERHKVEETKQITYIAALTLALILTVIIAVVIMKYVKLSRNNKVFKECLISMKGGRGLRYP